MTFDTYEVMSGHQLLNTENEERMTCGTCNKASGCESCELMYRVTNHEDVNVLVDNVEDASIFIKNYRIKQEKPVTKNYWCVFIHRSGDVSYGTDYSVFLARVFESKEDAEKFTASPEYADMLHDIKYDPAEYYGGDVETSIVQMSDESLYPEYIGGASYAE